jgi:hypothetical protein
MSGRTRRIPDDYAVPSDVTDLSAHSEFIRWVTADVPALFRVVQGLLIHDGWMPAYGVQFNDEQRYDFKTLRMDALLDKALELSSMNLSIPRPPESRVIGCCREFATLMTAFLRAKGIPARSRCGFAAYFDDSAKWEDHWVCEYWRDEESRWILADPQMDPYQQSTLGLTFSPLDVPRAQYATGGEAWTACRSGELSPEDFGIGDDPATYGLSSLYGLWFVRGNLLRDFASLNKVETVPLLMRLWRNLSWNAWRLVGSGDDELSSSDLGLLDRIAELTTNIDERFHEARGLFEREEALRPGRKILTYEE